MMYVALAVIGIGALFLLCRLLWSSQLPKKNVRIVAIASLTLFMVLGTFVLLSRIPPIVALFTMILPFLRIIFGTLLATVSFFLRSIIYAKMLNLFQGLAPNPFSSNGSAPQDSDSETQTQEIAMKLNHQTGKMTGTVLTGEYGGRDLDSLSDVELSTVYRNLQSAESKRLLEAYVSRHRPHIDETSNEKSEHEAGAQMSVKRAADILDVDVSATKEEIVAAHRRLMDKLHPDKGGSSYLAAELNEAKLVLLEAIS